MTAVELGDHLVLSPVLPLGWAAAVAAALLATAVAAALLRPAPLGGAKRAVLLVLRLLVVAAVAALLLRPVLRWTASVEVPGEVAVLLDASRSMAVRDALGPDGRPASRAAAVRQAVLASQAAYTALAARYVVNPLAFGSATRPIGHFAPLPEDARTDPGEALAHLADRGGVRLAAVVLVSDGRANRARTSPEAAARRLAERGVAVHTLLAGSDAPTDRVRDVAVRDLRAPARVLLRHRAEVRATVSTLGLAGQAVDLVLTVDGREVDRRRLTPASNRTSEEVVFTPALAEPGLARVALAAEPVADELLPGNNRAETSVRVEEGGVRVLYLDGRIHPEGKYVARALDGTAEILLDRRILIGSGAASAAPRPADLDAVDVLVLGDLRADVLPAETLAEAARRVRDGRLSVLALGGLDALGAGGWAGTPLADLLPVQVRPADGQVDGPVRLRLAPDGAGHFIFTGANDGADAGSGAGADAPAGAVAPALDALPPLSGASAVGPLVPGARLLARADDGRTLLAVRELGRARSAVLAADTTWQWVLAAGDAAASGADLHRRLWRGLVLWLAGRDGRPRADLWVATDRPRYLILDPDQPPAAQVTAHGPGQGGPALRLEGPDGVARPLLAAPAAGDWRADVPLRTPGDYTVVAEADAGGSRRRAETRFTVEEPDLELAEVLADREALERIARAGGGSCRPLDALGALFGELAAGPPRRYNKEAARHQPLAAGRTFLGLVIGLLAAEWLLRRRWAAA